jgi:hypothetical protein
MQSDRSNKQKVTNMNHILKVFFRYRADYYSAYITIVHQFETDFFFIELLDEDMIDNFSASLLSYVGERGFKKLEVYQSDYHRPILSNIYHIIKNAQQICNESSGEIPDEEYTRQN